MARHISRSRRFALVLALLALNAPVVRAGGFIHAVESWFSPSLDEAPAASSSDAPAVEPMAQNLPTPDVKTVVDDLVTARDSSKAPRTQPRAEDAAADEDMMRRIEGTDGQVVLLHGGLVDGGDSAADTTVLAGLGSDEGLVFCHLAPAQGAQVSQLASPGHALDAGDDKAYFHGGYRVWDHGNDFEDVDEVAVFDGASSKWECAGEACLEAPAAPDKKEVADEARGGRSTEKEKKVRSSKSKKVAELGVEPVGGLTLDELSRWYDAQEDIEVKPIPKGGLMPAPRLGAGPIDEAAADLGARKNAAVSGKTLEDLHEWYESQDDIDVRRVAKDGYMPKPVRQLLAKAHEAKKEEKAKAEKAESEKEDKVEASAKRSSSVGKKEEEQKNEEQKHLSSSHPSSHATPHSRSSSRDSDKKDSDKKDSDKKDSAEEKREREEREEKEREHAAAIEAELHPKVPVFPGKRDEHVAIVTPKPIALDEGSNKKQKALIVFGGRDENDARLDTMYALGLEDRRWREIKYSPPEPPAARATVRADEKKKSSEGKGKKGGASIDEGSHAGPEQGPLGLPDVVAQAHEDGSLYPLARSGATAVATDDNVMFLFGGFVVEGRLGFNVGELLAFDLDKREFFYPKVSGDLPVRRNKHTAVVDDEKRMWVWGGSVWDHTGGTSAYASTATHFADLSDPRNVKWTKADTSGFPPSQRRLHSAVHKNGVMYVIGGEDYHSKEFLADVHALDLSTLHWSQPHVAGAAGGGRIRAAAVGIKLGNPAVALARCGEGTPVPAITGELQPKDDKAVTEATEKQREPREEENAEKAAESKTEEPESKSKSEKKREEESKTADEGKKEAKQQQQHKEAALGVEGVDHRAIAAGWMPRGNVLVESQRLWSVDRDSESRVLSIASSLAKLDIPGVPKPVVVPALGKSHHSHESDEKDEKDEKKDDEKDADDAPAPAEEYVDPFGNPVRPMAPPTDPDPDYVDDYDKDDKDDKDDDKDHHHHKHDDGKDSNDADKQSDDDDGPTPDPVMPWGYDDEKDGGEKKRKDDAALGAAPEQPADGEDVHRSEASLGARDPMALLAEARREADAARAAKMRAIEGMMRRTSSGGDYGVKAASAAAALGVAPENRDREDAEDATGAAGAAGGGGIASLGARVTAAERSSGMGRAKAAVGVGVVVAAVAAFGVVAVVGAVTRLAAPGGSDRGSDAERIPLVSGPARGGIAVVVDDAQLATGDASQSWQSRAAFRGMRRANGDAGDDWADVV